VLFGHQLAVCQEPDADDEVLDTLEAQLRALAPHRGQRHSRPHRKITRSTDRPGIAAHRLDETPQRIQRRLGVEHELGDAIATGSLDQAEQCVTPVRREDLNTRLGREIEPVRLIGAFPGSRHKVAQPSSGRTRRGSTAALGLVRSTTTTSPGRTSCGRRRDSPMSRIDLRFEGAAQGGACAVD